MENKHLDAIVEYEKSRLLIKELSDKISDSMTVMIDDEHGYQHGVTSCTCGLSEGRDCLGELWKWNREYYLQRQCWQEAGGSYIGPFSPNVGEKPILCEAGKITESLVEERKIAKLRFGRAKTRLSNMAKAYL